ncbi:MAG: MCE family protein [Acidimicrobiales bacterium]
MDPVRFLRPRRLGLGAALAAVVVAAGGCGISLQSLPKIGGITGPTFSVTAEFANVVNLPANAEVRVGAFTVGLVSAIQAQNFHAVITMRILKAERLPVGTTAEVRFDTPLGEDFVQLTPPAAATGVNQVASGPFLGPGSRIPESATMTAPSVEDTFGALGALLNGGGINQLQTIITETNKAFNGNQPQIHALINQLDTTLASLSKNVPNIDSALTAIAQLSHTLNQGSSTITNGIDALQPAVAVLASENGDLQQLVANVDRLAAVANNVVDQASQGFVNTVNQLGPVLDQITSVQSQLGPALSAIDSFERLTPPTAPGSYLQVALNATVGVPPVPAGALPLNKVTVDPPEASQSYDPPGIVTILETGLP